MSNLEIPKNSQFMMFSRWQDLTQYSAIKNDYYSPLKLMFFIDTYYISLLKYNSIENGKKKLNSLNHHQI